MHHARVISYKKKINNIKPKVIVLIISFNGKQLLEEAITSYLENDYENFQVVVIDNGSTDQTKEWVQKHFPDVFVLRTEKNLKYSGGLNFGMNYAFLEKDADYVLITNNDVKADSRLITELVNTALKYNDAGFVIGKVYYYDEPNKFQTVGKKYDPVTWNGGHIGNNEFDSGQYDEETERYWCDDIYWLVKREVWQETGGYDTEFAFQGEDFDWQIRAKKIGYKIYYTPKAKLWHKVSATIGKMSSLKMYYDSRNPLIIHMKYRNADEFRRFFHYLLKQYFRSIPRLILKLRFSIVYALISGTLSALNYGFKNKILTLKHFI